MKKRLLGMFMALALCSALCVSAAGATSYQISVVMLSTSTSITLDVELSDTISHVKQEIQNKVGTPPNQQTLFFAGNTLEDDKTLEYYNIQKDATLHLMVQTSGAKGTMVSNDILAAMIRHDPIIQLWSDLDLPGGMKVDYDLTLDLNGFVLKLTDTSIDEGRITVEGGGNLTIIDSNPYAQHKFTPNANGLWVLGEENGTKPVNGGVITGGSEGNGGGVKIETGGSLTMTGGNIVGCRVNGQGGGVYVSSGSSFTMNGGSIAGCVADLDSPDAQGGGVYVQNGCEANEANNFKALTPGVFTMNGGSIIDCATKSGMGGSVFIQNATRESDYNGLFTMNGGSISDSGVSSNREEDNTIYNLGTFIANGGTVTNSGSGKFNCALYNWSIVRTEQGKPGTKFSGAVLTDNGSDIGGGSFNGPVNNYGKITGGTFNGEVVNNGVITGGTFYGKVSGTGTIADSAKHTVSFDTNGDSAIPAQKILRGQKAVKPDDPSRPGYSFAGWYEGSEAYGFNVPVLRDLTLTAQWTAERYAITYDLDGGTAEGNPDSYTIEAENITLNAPTKAGYTFTGWSGTGLTGENNMTVTIEKGSIGDRSYTAHWRYNGRGGSGSSPSYPVSVPDKTNHGSVTVSPKNASKGSTVTITVTPDSGYVLETISVTDKNGNDLKLTDKGNGKYTFTMPGSKVEVKVTFMEDNSVLNFFYDVPNDAYYYEAVKWAAENGITGGVGNSLFAPNQPCTRAQIVTFLWRAAGSPVVNYLMPFTDVDESAYYAEAVRWAASTGIVTGLTEMTFGTNDVCTRAQAATMIYRYAQAQGKGFTGAWMFLLPFTDVPEWAYESVAWCYMNGVTTGVNETAFAPGNDCTRAQIVTFLWRAFSK